VLELWLAPMLLRAVGSTVPEVAIGDVAIAPPRP
jgi:hypothetical protein